MTILPTKRTVGSNSGDESKENNNQNNSKDRNSRLRDEHNVANESGSTTTRRQFSYNPSTSDRKELTIKLYKEPSIELPRERRERERQKLRELRRKRPGKRTIKSEEGSDTSTTSDVDAGPSKDVVEKKEVDEDGSGCNSEDEYDSRRVLTNSSPSDEEWARRDAYFSRSLLKLGYEIKRMHEDGACLFRAIADQVYGDQELHSTVRTQCMDYIVKNQDYFEPYVTEDFNKYVARKRKWHVHGNHLEIQAISEMYNRTIEVYCYHTEPINIFNATSINSYEPIRVSYHRMCHYNSITNPKKPSVLVGLGLPNYCTRYDMDGREIRDAVRQSEELLIEQTMLEDKIKATDWEATNEALEEQVARESYIQYYRDAERRLKTEPHATPSAASSSSTVTSAMCSSPRTSRRGSVSPKGSMSPKGSPKENTSPKHCYSVQSVGASTHLSTAASDPSLNTEIEYNKQIINLDFSASATASSAYEAFGLDCEKEEKDRDKSIELDTQIVVPPNSEEDWDETIMAQVLAESQLTYFQDLKRKYKKHNGSPGPSTSQ